MQDRMAGMLERDFVVFFGLVLSSALWAVVHLSLGVHALSHKSSAWPMRLLGLVPPATPVVAFRMGARVRAGLWVAFAAAYLVLRSAS